MQLKQTIAQMVIWYDINDSACSSMVWYPRGLCSGLSFKDEHR